MKKTILALVAAAALMGTAIAPASAAAAARKTVPWPFSDSWTKNMLVGTLVGCGGGVLAGSYVFVGGPHAVATATGIGCGAGLVIGATFPHSRF